MTRDAHTDRLLDLAYGELPRREARELEAHVATCEACRAELDRIRGTRRIMAALPPEPAPERGERTLLAAAREAAEAGRPRRLVPRWLLAGAAVAASVVVVGVVSYRVAELGPRRVERAAFPGKSPYASAPPAAAAEAARPAETGPGDPRGPGAAVAGAPALEPKGASQEPPAVASAPPPRSRAAAPVAPVAPPAETPRPFASAPSVREEAPAAAAPEREAARELAKAERPGGAPAPSAPQARPGAAGPPPDMAAQAPAPLGAAPGAMRKSASAPGIAGGYAGSAAAADAAPGAPPNAEVRTFAGCEGEAVRRVEVDANGRTVRYVREGRIDGRRVRVVHAFGPDGRPTRVTVTDLDDPGAALDARALGLSLPARAEDAGIDAPPRCGR